MTKAQLIKKLNEWSIDDTPVVVDLGHWSKRHEILDVKKSIDNGQLILIISAEPIK